MSNYENKISPNQTTTKTLLVKMTPTIAMKTTKTNWLKHTMKMRKTLNIKMKTEKYTPGIYTLH